MRKAFKVSGIKAECSSRAGDAGWGALLVGWWWWSAQDDCNLLIWLHRGVVLSGFRLLLLKLCATSNSAHDLQLDNCWLTRYMWGLFWPIKGTFSVLTSWRKPQSRGESVVYWLSAMLNIIKIWGKLSGIPQGWMIGPLLFYPTHTTFVQILHTMIAFWCQLISTITFIFHFPTNNINDSCFLLQTTHT